MNAAARAKSMANQTAMQTIVPILRYRDARAAIAALCACFGFVELFSEPAAGAIVRHARLKLGTGEIMPPFVTFERLWHRTSA
jgi:hypothetical protein